MSKKRPAADQLAADPRVEQAKKLLLEAVAEHSDKLSAVAPPDENLSADYQKQLTEFGAMRGGSLWYPYIASGLGNGPFVELADGSVKLDFITGIGVHGFGHSHPDLVSAGIDAALSDTVMQGNLQQNGPTVDLTRLLINTANKNGASLNHCFLSTSGAMANENSLKMVYQKKFPANRLLAFKDCFAGRTIALSQVTDRPKYRDGVPESISVDQLTYFDADDPAGSTQRTINEIQHHVKRFPGKHAAIWIEMIQGEGGYYPGDERYFKAIIAECQKHDIAIIADEVQTFARTTEPFAFQHFRLDKLIDMATIGKITQVCATLFSDKYVPRPGLISQTFIGSTWGIMAARVIVQGLIDRGNFGKQGRNIKLHEYFVAGLERINRKHPGSIAGPFGLGGMLAFTPFDGTVDCAKEMAQQLFHEGLMAFIAGGNPARMRFLMPIGVVTNEHIDLACEIIERIVSRMSADLASTKKKA